jgi:hypothetical protein
MSSVGDKQNNFAPTHKRSGYKIVFASENRISRIRRQVLRAFIASNGQPITVREVLVRAYPKLKRFNDWHRWSCRRALLRHATIIARNLRGRGRPCLWAPKDQSGANPVPTNV